jgi:hypothetical protein
MICASSMLFLCSRVETYNVKLSLMFRIKDFEVHKRIFVYANGLDNAMYILFFQDYAFNKLYNM